MSGAALAVVVGAGAQRQRALRLALVSRWQPRPLITTATTAITAGRMPMAMGILRMAMLTHIDALTTATHIHTGVRTMDIRTAGTSCIGIMDTRVTTSTIGASIKRDDKREDGLRAALHVMRTVQSHMCA